MMNKKIDTLQRSRRKGKLEKLGNNDNKQKKMPSKLLKQNRPEMITIKWAAK